MTCRSLIGLLTAALLGLVLSSCGSGNSSSYTNPVPPSISVQPADLTVTVGQPATFTVVASGTPMLTYQWFRGTMAGMNPIPGAMSPSYTLASPTLADNNTPLFDVVITNGAGNATSLVRTLTVNPVPPPSNVTVLTYHNDNARSGLNSNETILTTANVGSAKFQRLGMLPVTGLVDAEPLYVGNLTVNGAAHNVVFVATESDTVYAFDADNFALLWQKSALLAGETTVAPSDVGGCTQVNPQIGITSTPVIDPASGPHGAIYVVAMSKDSTGNFHHRLHALDLTTGAELFAGPTDIQATFQKPGQAGQVVFDPKQYKERTGLLLLGGVVYTAWASHCDSDPYNGWIISYDATTLAQKSVLNVTPNGTRGAIWQSGAGLAADSSGNIYFLDGNGMFDPPPLNAQNFPAQGDFGNAFLKLSTTGGSLAVADYFEMSNQDFENAHDIDLGSGGGLVLMDLADNGGTVHHLAVGAGKDANIYVVNRDSMGKFNAASNNVYQEIPNVLQNGIWSMPAYFNKTIYFGPVANPILAFGISNAMLSNTPTSHTGASFGYPGATPSISANGTTNGTGIVWAIENGSTTGTLRAFDATNLGSELYNSNLTGGRDQFPTTVDCKFVTPMIANGKVYVGTATSVVVFGLLP